VPAGLKLDMLAVQMDDTARAAFVRNETLIKRLARLESVTDAAATPKGAITIPAEGATFAIPLAGIIDVVEEKARLTKSLDKLGKEIGGLKGRLNNPNFVASAPEDVVTEAKANLEAREEEAGTLKAALARLAELE
jgi:valyl-tRNA synthetase